MPEEKQLLCGADCDNLDAVLRSVSQIREQIEKCKRCKLPVEELEEQNETHGKLAAAIKAEWFPARA